MGWRRGVKNGRAEARSNHESWAKTEEERWKVRREKERGPCDRLTCASHGISISVYSPHSRNVATLSSLRAYVRARCCAIAARYPRAPHVRISHARPIDASRGLPRSELSSAGRHGRSTRRLIGRGGCLIRDRQRQRGEELRGERGRSGGQAEVYQLQNPELSSVSCSRKWRCSTHLAALDNDGGAIVVSPGP